MAKNEIKYLTAIKSDKRVKKFCRFKKYRIRYIDYKDVEFLKKFLNEQLKIQLLRDDNMLRHMFTVLDKYAVEYNNKKRSGVPTGTEKVEG